MGFSSYNGYNSDSESELISTTIPIAYTSYQLQKLEELFLDNNSPNNNMIEEWSLGLGMEPKQIKYWFQIRMLQKQSEEYEKENNALRRENESFRLDNSRLNKQLLQGSPCPTCVGNVALREGHQNLSNIPARILEVPERFECEIIAEDHNLDLQLRLAPPASTESLAEPSSE